jgi:hypothetical protein
MIARLAMDGAKDESPAAVLSSVLQHLQKAWDTYIRTAA